MAALEAGKPDSATLPMSTARHMPLASLKHTSLACGLGDGPDPLTLPLQTATYMFLACLNHNSHLAFVLVGSKAYTVALEHLLRAIKANHQPVWTVECVKYLISRQLL
jgi:hypothetical protein